MLGCTVCLVVVCIMKTPACQSPLHSILAVSQSGFESPTFLAWKTVILEDLMLHNDSIKPWLRGKTVQCQTTLVWNKLSVTLLPKFSLHRWAFFHTTARWGWCVLLTFISTAHELRQFLFQVLFGAQTRQKYWELQRKMRSAQSSLISLNDQ